MTSAKGLLVTKNLCEVSELFHMVFLSASMSVVKPTSFSSKTSYRAAVLYGLKSEN